MGTQALVAERQLLKTGIPPLTHSSGKRLSAKQRRDAALRDLFGDRKVHLDHNPALLNRQQSYVKHREDGTLTARYEPDANDPDYLIWRPADEHDIKTRVHGDGAQLSDLAIARKRKRKQRKAKRPKRKWPTRPFVKAVLVCLGVSLGGMVNDPAAAAISHRAGGASRHLAARPMGFDIVSDRLLRSMWRDLSDYRGFAPDDHDHAKRRRRGD